MYALIIGVFVLALSGLNVYLPDVGNLFDVWRIGFSGVAFILGWAFIIRGLAELVDEYGY